MSEDLPFDETEFDEADFDEVPSLPTHCAVCDGHLGDPFWVEGRRQIICTSCKEDREGFAIGAFGVASVVGAIAAVGAGLAWGTFTWLTHYNIGFIAIAAGWVVATGIRTGSGGRGGLPYQALAAVLTYFSIAVAETFFAVSSIRAEDGLGAVESLLSFLVGLPIVLVQLIPMSIQNGDVFGLLINGFALYQAIQMTGGGGMEGPFSREG